jgi:hypothetical protein
MRETPYLMMLQRSMFHSVARILWERQRKRPDLKAIQKSEASVNYLMEKIKDETFSS